MSFDDALQAFRELQTKMTAGVLLHVILIHFSDDGYGDDDLLNAIAEVSDWLQKDE